MFYLTVKANGCVSYHEFELLGSIPYFIQEILKMDAKAEFRISASAGFLTIE